MSKHRDLVLAKSPLGYWRFEDGAAKHDDDANTLLLVESDTTDGSTTIVDTAGTTLSNDGVSHQTEQSKFGGSSLYFDGSSWFDSDNIGQVGTIDATLECWIYPTANSGNRTLFSRWAVDGGNLRWNCFLSSSLGRIDWVQYNNPPSQRTAYATFTALSLNTWHHIAITRKDVDGTITFFINGVKQTTNGTVAVNPYGDFDQLRIGAKNLGVSSSSDYFAGYMDDVRISNVIRYENSFTPLADTSGNGYTLINDGTPTTVDGGVVGSGKAVDLDSGDSVKRSTTATADLRVATGGFGIEVWFKPTSTGTFQFMVSKGANSGSNGNYSFYISDSGSIVFSFWRGSGGNEYFQTGTGVVNFGEWNHMVFTHTWGSAANTAIYHNGSEITGISWTGQDGTGTPTSQNVEFSIGERPDGAYPSDGTYDEVAVYNTLLTAGDVKEHYMAGAEVKSSALTITEQTAEIETGYGNLILSDSPVAYWQLDEAPAVSMDDTFTGTTINQDLWDDTYGSASGGSGSVTQASGVLSLSADNDNATTYVRGALARHYMVGDFDVQFDFSNLSYTGTGTRYFVMLCGMEANGYQEAYCAAAKTAANTDVYAAAAGDGTESQLSRSGSSGKLRIARVGSTITCYYWNGSSWITIDTATGRDTAPAFVLVRAQGNSDGDSVVSGDIDNFTVTADSIVKRLAVDTAGVYGMGNYGPATQGSSPAIHDGSAYVFNGTDQYAYKATAGFQLSDTEGSVEAWFKTTDTGEGVIWATSDEASNTWYAYLAINNGEVKWRIQNNAANYVYETSGQSLNDGKLHHVVVAIGPSNTRRIYVDGVNTGATGNGFWFNNPASNLLNTDNVTIGALKYSTGEVSHFDGTIDEVAYYDAELSAAQVTSHYEAGKSTVPDALTITTYSVDFIPDAYGQVVYDKTPVAWWRLDDGDPYLDYAVFGSHFDGADDATTFTDDIGSATFTRHGGTTLQDTQKKFGATSYYNGVANSGSALEINGSTSNTDYQLTGDFTLEMWVFVTANTEFNFTGLFTKVDTSSRGDGAISSYEFGLTYSAPNFFPMVNNLNNAGGTNYGLGAGATGFPINEWHHIVFERYGGRLTTYLDGAVNNFRTGLNDFVGTLGARRVLIGASTQNTTGERHSLHGYIDDLILYNGVAKYKGQAFAAPTAEFVDAHTTTIADFYGNNNGVSSGSPVVQQPSLIVDANNSISFNGTTQYIRRAASDWQGSDSLGSIAAWFSTTYTGGDQTIFSSSDEATNNSYLALLLRNDRIRIQKYDGAITTFLGDYIVDVHDGNPHHVVLTSSGTAYKLYLDGEEVTITATQGTNNGDWLADLSGRDNVTIGVMERSTKINYFNGTIDDVAYFDTELDAGIINHMYLVGAEASTPALTVTPQSPVTIEQKTHYEKVIEDSNPISWWKLDEYTWDGIDTFDEGSVPDPDVWGKYNAGTVTSDTYTVSNGAMNLGVVSGGVSATVGARTRFVMSGDFDVILDADNFSHDAGTSSIFFHIQTTFIGGVYYNMGVVQSTNIATQNFRKDVNGSATEYSKTDDTPFRVRMARVGTTLTFYSDDNVGSWTSRGSHTVGTQDATVYLLAYAFGNGCEISVDALGVTFTADSIVQRDHKDYGSEAEYLYVVSDTTRVPGLAEPKLSNHAYDFNGTDQYLSSSIANYRSSDNIGTVEAWVAPDSTTEGAVFSVCTSDAGERLVVFASSNLIRVYSYDATTADDHVHGSHNVPAGERFHMAVTTTGSAWKLYVNGVELTPVVGSGINGGYWLSDLTSNDTDRVYIGVWQGNDTFFGNFDGTIDEVIYYNRQLSESEIHEHYQAGANPYRTVRGQIEYDRAVNHWPMGKSGIPGAATFISLYLRGRADLTDYSVNSTTFNGTHSYASGGKFIDPNRGDNQAINFNGTGHIYTSTTYGADSIWDMQGDFTIQAWVKLDTYQDWRTICAWFDNGGEGWRLLVGATGVLHFSTDAGLTNGFFSAAGAVPTGEWVHVAATNKDGINKGWVNGKLVATQKVWSFTPPSTAREFRIGSTDGSNWKWDGQMQEILIHDGIALWDRDFEPPHGTNFTYDDFGTAPLDLGVGNGADVVDSLNADGVNDYRDIPHLASKATDFNGTNEYLFSNLPDFRSSDTEGSIEAWFNARSDVADNRVIFNVSDKDHVSGYNRFVLYLSSAASYTIRLYTIDNAGTAHSVSTTASGWADSKTHHVVLTSSGTAWKIYVDGVNQALTVNTGSNNGNWIGDLGTTDVVHISTQETQSIQSDWFDGTIDDVAIYDYELSADQVAEHYELGVSQNTDALVITTQAATVTNDSSGTVSANTAALTITEYQIEANNVTVNTIVDALLLTEQQATVENVAHTIDTTYTGSNALLIGPLAAGIQHDAIYVNTIVDPLIITGQLAGIQHDAISVDTNVDALILTEYPMTIGFDYSATTIVDTLILTGQKAKVANSYADSVIQDGPISFLRFESSSGVVYSDYSGNGNTGIANVALTRVPSLVFNDREARATEIAATQQIVGTTGLIDQFPFTVEYFFEYTSTGTNCQHWCTTDKASSYAGVAMGTNAADQVYVRFGNATFQATDDRRDYVTGAILTDGAIHHVAAVFTGHAAGTIYINGVPNALTYLSGSGTYTDFDGGTKPFVIGSSTQLYLNAAGDTFDEFAIYDKALTAGEIEAHYNAAEAPPGFLYTFLETLTHTTYQSEIVHSAISVDTNPDPLLITERQASIDFSAVFVNATRDPLIITERQASIVFEPYTYYTAPDTLQIYEFTAGINADWPLVFAKTVPLALTEYNAGIFLPIVGINTVPDVLLQSPQRADIQWDAIYVQQLAPTAFTLTEYAATISTGINATSVALTTTTYVADPDLDPNLLPINASTDTLAITELAAFIEKDTTVEASSDSLVFTSGGDVLLGWDIALETSTAALTLTPLGLDFPINIDGTTVALTITEYQSTPTLPVTINAAPDQVQVNAQQASIQNLTEIDTNVDALVITEQLSGIYFSPAINVDTNIDALVFTGQTIDIGFARTISASLFPVLLTERPVSFALNAGIADPLAITTHVADPDMTIFVDQAAATTMTVAEQQADVALDVTIEATSQDLRFGLWSVIITLPILTIETNIDPLVIGQWSTTIIVQNTVFDCAVDTLTLTGQPAEIQLFKQIDAGTDYLNIFEKEAQVAIPVFGIDATQVSLSLTEQQSSITNEVTTLIRAENQPVFYITERQADVLMPIDIVNATKDQVVAASYPASIDMPIINIDAGVDTIVISGETQSFSYFSTLTIDPGSFVQQNYNIGFEWSDDPATILTIEETSFITIYNKIVFRIDIPSGPVGYKIVMSGPTEYELIK